MISKKALFSVLLIGLIGVAAGAGTFAYFSDTEQADGMFQAGTIDIAINDQNPWMESFEMIDMKPCKTTEEANVELTNVGTNPALIYKHIDVTDYNTGLERFECPVTNEMFSSEPEWTIEANPQFDEEGNVTNVDINRIDDIHNQTEYTLTIDGQQIPLCLFDIETVGDVDCNWMFLGVLEPGDSMMVNQTYKLSADAGNEYQGDQFNFTMTFKALQTNDETTLEDHVVVDLTEPEVPLKLYDTDKETELEVGDIVDVDEFWDRMWLHNVGFEPIKVNVYANGWSSTWDNLEPCKPVGWALGDDQGVWELILVEEIISNGNGEWQVTLTPVDDNGQPV
ncbi:TasA family protein [Methanonatronarchaeum sp. AMET-Sl]|uniref:TasA family protein n=1 Tax=Methanonatronarchaeum sp. AMET-Sl TaxID=3037654 RepID=UPI00244DA966|nr:TasA family protein [Methanonatronarchaeum sp. AMET-Sl]WGI17067.1 TasA family protein [Methanonatronarchaeum sp. AMET-Sl]